jgi:hypothetical protein
MVMVVDVDGEFLVMSIKTKLIGKSLSRDGTKSTTDDAKAKIWIVDYLEGCYDTDGIQLTNCINSGYIHHIIHCEGLGKVEVERSSYPTNKT